MVLFFYRKCGRYSQKVTNLETANFSHLFYGTPRVNTFIHFNDYESEIK